MFFLNWIFITIVVIIIGVLFFSMMYYKHLYQKELENKKVLEATIEEAEYLIKKYQISLQRALGNLEILNNEMNKLKNDIKAVKSRSSQYRLENERLKHKVTELENKIEALL